jgi:outer membrane protein assembly factor BamB
MRLGAAVAVAVLAVASSAGPANANEAGRPGSCDWNQWGGGPSHDGQVCVDGQRGLRMLARFVVDPFAPQISAEFGDNLPVHYPVPLVDGDDNVFVLRKGGNYVSCDPPGSGQPAPCGSATIDQQTWTLRALRWRHGQLTERWTFTSDWKPVPLGWEAMFQAATTDRYVYVPGAGGTVFQLDKDSGRVLRRVNPFGTTVAATTWVSGGITVNARGDLYYNVVSFDPAAPGTDARSWLVNVPRHGPVRTVDYRTLVPGAPGPSDLCYARFNDATPVPPRPWPPPPQPDGSPTLPPQFPCLSQRAATNVTPAIGPDGTIFTVTRPHSLRAEGYVYLVALRPDLSLKWATSLRGHLNDGCGVLTPYGDGTRDCRPGSTPGVDLATNLPPAGWAPDLSSSSPTALPDGGVLFGAFTGYNGQRGHLMKFDRHGQFMASYDFGWDLTPALYVHDHTYSVVVKDNQYLSRGPFTMVRLNADLQVEWRHANTETQTCQREPDGTISCVDTGEHPNGFEWCVNAPVVDRDGNVFGLNEDGHMYVVDRHGNERERVFLTRTLSAAYTPLSIDHKGRIYAQNNGELYVIGH